MIVFDVHSCYILNEKLLLKFIKSLQLPEGSRTHMLTNLQRLIGEVKRLSPVSIRTNVCCVYLD